MKWFVDMFKWFVIIFVKWLWKGIANGFHKTPLSLLDLRFKNLSSKIRHLGQVEKKVEGFAARWFKVFLKWLRICYLVKVLYYLYETPVINKLYILVCIYFAWCYIDHRYVLSVVNSLKEVENKILL